MSSLPNKVEVAGRNRAYNGFLKVDQVQLSYERFDGAMSETVTREVVDRGAAVALLPYDPKTGKVLMIRQFLVGAHEAGRPAWPLQTIAGMIDKGEEPVDSALREAREEAGLDVAREDILPGPVYLVSPGAFTETIHVFFVYGDLSGAGDGIHGLAEENENIRTELLDLDEALDQIELGHVMPSLAVVALTSLKLKLIPRQRYDAKSAAAKPTGTPSSDRT